MFNPLHPFEPRFLEAFRKKGVKAFVKQTYPRGRGIGEQEMDAFILIHFEELLPASQYYDVVKRDANRALLRLDEPGDVDTIYELLQSARVFMMLKVKDAEYRAKRSLDKKIRAFLEYKLNWQPGRDDAVRFLLDVQFGEVYAKLIFRSKEIKVKLEEIEKASYVL